MINIILQTIKDKKISIIMYGAGMFLLMLLFTSMYPTILAEADKFEELFSAYPESFMQAFGVDDFKFDTIEKFLSVEYYSIMWPIAMIVLMISLAGAAIAGEIENGTIEHALAKPIERWQLFLSKYLGGLIVVLIFTFVSVFTVFPAALITGIDVNFKAQVLIFILSMFFSTAVYSLGMMFTTIFSEKGRVSLVMGVSMLIMYVLSIASKLIEQLEWLQYTSLFYYFDYDKALVEHAIGAGDLVVFVEIIVLSLIVSLLWFERRDITT
ncbi:MAG: ABC transporter permease subunit [Patescibacteria group bacterium]